MRTLAGTITSDLDPSELSLVVPLGATEQHGPHLPLDTDAVIVEAIAATLAISRSMILAPTLPFGSSGEHAGFPGTISIGQEALHRAVVELARDTAAWRETVFVCWHGGNAEPLERARRTLAAESCSALIWEAPRGGWDAHAGRIETSLMLALAPSSVRLDRAEAGNVAPLEALMPRLRDGGLAAVAPSGVLGDPAGATAREGREILGRLSNQLRTDYETFVRRRRLAASRPKECDRPAGAAARDIR